MADQTSKIFTLHCSDDEDVDIDIDKEAITSADLEEFAAKYTPLSFPTAQVPRQNLFQRVLLSCSTLCTRRP